MAKTCQRRNDAAPSFLSYKLRSSCTAVPSRAPGTAQPRFTYTFLENRNGLPSGAIWHTEDFSKALERGYWACVLLELVFVVNQAECGRGYVKTCPRCGHPPFLAPLHRVHTCPVCAHPRAMVDTIRGLCDCVGASPDLMKAISSPQFEDVFSIINELTSHLTNKESL